MSSQTLSIISPGNNTRRGWIYIGAYDVACDLSRRPTVAVGPPPVVQRTLRLGNWPLGNPGLPRFMMLVMHGCKAGARDAPRLPSVSKVSDSREPEGQHADDYPSCPF